MRSKTLLLLLLLCNGIFANSSVFNADNYYAIESVGEIPEDFILSSRVKYENDLDELKDAKSREDFKIKKSYFEDANFSIGDLLLSGQVTFGDPLSEYASKILDHILANDPELRKEIRVYHLKSPSLNAMATQQGIIFVNTGLFAYLENEAQVAFVLCHELAHYLQNHNLEGYTEKQKIYKGKGIYGEMSTDEKIEKVFGYKIENEFEADSLGIERYEKLGYDMAEVQNLLTNLHYSYTPFINSPITHDFLGLVDLKLPPVYFLDSVNAFKPIEDGYDKFHTHPNIFKRKNKVERQVTANAKPTSKYTVYDKSQFDSIAELAKFECIRLLFTRKKYGDIIYYASNLLKTYPNNKFLKLSRAKALYGLSMFRTAEEFHLVTKSYSRIEGESQQVYYFFRQLSPEQLNVIAIKSVSDMLKEYPDDEALQMMQTELINNLVSEHNIKLDDFYSSPKEFNEIELPNAITAAEKIKLQRECKDFILNAFVDLKKDAAFVSKFIEAQKIETENERRTIKEKQKNAKAKEQYVRKSGLDISDKSAVILDPLYIEMDRQNNEKHLKSEKLKLKLDKILGDTFDDLKLKGTILTSTDISTYSLDQYNLMCRLKEWREELLTKNVCAVLPLSSYYKSSPLLSNIHVLVCPGLYRTVYSTYYNMAYYDLNTGKRLFKNEKKVMSFTEGASNFKEDIKILTK